MGKARIGVSGWDYDSWRGGAYYPADLQRGRTLQWLTRRFETVEINGSFYSLKSRRQYQAWADAAPRAVRYAVKGSRFITHNKKLKEVERPLANFFASGVLALGEKLGPILWQLPGHLRCERERIERFLELLPHDTDAAADLARHHDDRVTDPQISCRDGRHRVRHAVEARHESCFSPEFVALLRRHGIALVMSHAREWPYAEDVTAGFVYVRLHGPGETYASSYSDADLEHWTKRIRSWRSGEEPPDAARVGGGSPPVRKERDIYVYFDNDQHAFAPHDAARLQELLTS